MRSPTKTALSSCSSSETTWQWVFCSRMAQSDFLWVTIMLHLPLNVGLMVSVCFNKHMSWNDLTWWQRQRPAVIVRGEGKDCIWRWKACLRFLPLYKSESQISWIRALISMSFGARVCAADITIGAVVSSFRLHTHLRQSFRYTLFL